MNISERLSKPLWKPVWKRLSLLVVVFGLTSLLGACATSTTGTGEVGADRSQLLLVPSEQLDQMGAEAYAALKADAAKKGVLNTRPAMLQRVRAIAGRIAPQSKVFRDDAPGWNWEVNLITSEQMNAFVMPGGKIMFYTGLIERLNLTDAEIAIVMGHEIAHALREHAREQVSQAMAAQTAIGIGASIFGLGETSANLAGAGYQALVATKFSRTHEAEADRIGLELSARAGYEPRAGITLWRKMASASEGSRPPELLSSHPTDASRIKRIEALLPTVLPLYKRAPHP
jgi:predicted Zn-dependent protease